MSKRRTKSEKDPNMTDLNVEIPTDLMRRITIAKAETDDSIKNLVADWCERGLAELAAKLDKPYLKGKGAGEKPKAK